MTSVIRRLLPIQNSLPSTSTLLDLAPEAPRRCQATLCKFRSPKHRRLYTVRREFPIPRLVAGLPWRFAQHIERPVVPEAEFAALDLSYISRQWIR
jgi:hypothetical protein